MKTSKFKFSAYLETAGGPVCICSVNLLKDWSGSAEESGLYWQAIAEIGTEILEVFSDKFYFFNSETGNFALFRDYANLVIVEIISVESSFTMPWEGIEFNVEKGDDLPFSLNGLIALFDSSLTLNDWADEECLRAVNNTEIWNSAFVRGDFSIVNYVSFKSDDIHMVGILLTN